MPPRTSTSTAPPLLVGSDSYGRTSAPRWRPVAIASSAVTIATTLSARSRCFSGSPGSAPLSISTVLVPHCCMRSPNARGSCASLYFATRAGISRASTVATSAATSRPVARTGPHALAGQGARALVVQVEAGRGPDAVAQRLERARLRRRQAARVAVHVDARGVLALEQLRAVGVEHRHHHHRERPRKSVAQRGLRGRIA